MLLIAVAGAAYWVGVHSSSYLPNGGLVLDAKYLNFGEVWENEHFTWRLPVENRGETTVEVESFSKSCACLSVEPQCFVLKPGERLELRLEINLTSLADEAGYVSLRLWPRLKETGRENQTMGLGPDWKLGGRVRRVLAFDRYLFLGRSSELAQSPPVPSIPITVLVPLESLIVRSNLPGFSASVQWPQAGHAMLCLTSVSRRAVGEFEGKVTLQPVIKAGKLLPPQQLRFGGQIVPDVEVVPSALQVGGRLLGEVFDEVVSLRSLTGRAWRAVRTEAEGDGLSVEAVEGGGRFRVRQKVCRVGSTTNRVRFHAELDGQQVVVIVPVAYTGFESRN